MQNDNRGIIIHGGTLTAHEMAIGNNAAINKSTHESSDPSSAIKVLRNGLDILIKAMEKNQAEHEKTETLKSIKVELEKEKPNMLIVKPVLESIIDSIKAVGSIAGAALSVKNLLDLLV